MTFIFSSGIVESVLYELNNGRVRRGLYPGQIIPVDHPCHIVPMPHVEHKCGYCGSLHKRDRCPSCGAHK